MANTDGERGAGEERVFGPAGLVWRLTFRAKLKLYPFCLLMTIIALLLAGVSLTVIGMESALATAAGRLGADLMVIPAGAEVPLNNALIGGVPLKRALPPEVEKTVAGQPGVRLVARQYFLSSSPSVCCETGNLLLIGFDRTRDFTVLPWMAKRAASLQEENDLLVGSGIMKAKGAEFRLYNKTFRVAGRLERSGVGYFDNALFIPLAGVASMERTSRSGGGMPLQVLWDRPSLLLVQLSPGIDPVTVATAMEKGIQGVRVMTIPALFHQERLRLARITGASRLLMPTGWLVALAAGGAVQLLYWRGRCQTLGLLQFFGYGRVALMGFFAAETFLLSLLAMGGGCLAAFLLLRQFASQLAMTSGVPLLISTGSVVSAGIPWLCLSFAAGMAFETLIILYFLLRPEPAALMRGAR